MHLYPMWLTRYFTMYLTTAISAALPLIRPQRVVTIKDSFGRPPLAVLQMGHPIIKNMQINVPYCLSSCAALFKCLRVLSNRARRSTDESNCKRVCVHQMKSPLAMFKSTNGRPEIHLCKDYCHRVTCWPSPAGGHFCVDPLPCP